VLHVFDRYFDDDVELVLTHQPVTSTAINKRLAVTLYSDPPCFTAILYIDGTPILTEHMIDATAGYAEALQNQPHLISFLLEYASAKCFHEQS
jgi:hypothetical protein